MTASNRAWSISISAPALQTQRCEHTYSINQEQHKHMGEEGILQIRACFLPCHSTWCFLTSGGGGGVVCVCESRTHLSATWSRAWQFAESGCLLGCDRWPHRSPGSLLRWPSTAGHLEAERGNKEGRGEMEREEEWGEWSGVKRGTHRVTQRVVLSVARYTNMFQMAQTLENEWITRTAEAGWWTTNRLSTLKHVVQLK